MKGRASTSHRTERVASVIKRCVAVIIETELADPRIFGVSVVDVTVSKDLRHATVWVYIEHNDEEVLAALRNSAGYVKKLLGEQLSEMRVIPQIHFDMDKSQSYYEHIDQLIKGLHSNDGNGKNDSQGDKK